MIGKAFCRGCMISGHPHLEDCPEAGHNKYRAPQPASLSAKEWRHANEFDIINSRDEWPNEYHPYTPQQVDAMLEAYASAWNKRWKSALESLTPSGSEYVDDPERCVAFVREVRSSQMSAMLKFKQRTDAAEAALKAARLLIQESADCTLECNSLRNDPETMHGDAKEAYQEYLNVLAQIDAVLGEVPA